MRIYLAGLIQTGFVWRGNSQSEEVLVSDPARRGYPWDLESFHYLRSTKQAPEYFREIKKTIFLDSGAFSMFTQGIHIPLEEYAGYIKQNSDWIHVASNLDEIGAGKEAETWANQKALEKMGVAICPVHHARDDDSWLQRYLAEGYDYLFLGGMVPESTSYLRRWLDHIWDRYLVRKDGTARVKVHGFGLTALPLVRRYPWYSVDSTSWVLSGRFGSIIVDLPHTDVRISISSDSSSIHHQDRHFDTMSPAAQKALRERFEELGFSYEKLRVSYGARDIWNIGFFQRLMDRPDPVFKRRDVNLFE